jgi:hypothetical protein
VVAAVDWAIAPAARRRKAGKRIGFMIRGIGVNDYF